MAETISTTEPSSATNGFKRHRWRPEFLAWGVLIAFCCVSLLLCTTISFTIYNYFFRSTIPLEAELQVARGTVGITSPASLEESAERASRLISSLTTISTDEQSLGILSFTDELGSLYAHITSRPETHFTLLRSARPRFNMGGNDLIIELGQLRGRLDILIIERLDYEVRVRVLGPGESIATLSYPGRYEIEADESGIRLLNHSALFARLQGNESSRLVPKGYRASVIADDDSKVSLQAAYTNLVNDPSFARYFEFVADDAPENARWSCASISDIASDTLGQHRSATINGLETIRFLRQGEIAGHGETRCFYQFLGEMGEMGLAVNEYDYLGIQATILIQGQSLSRCGFRGSECPVMLRLDYVDRGGGTRRWFQGFFIPHADDSEQNNPLRCSNCPALHERVSAKTWYQFDSGNLFSIFPDDTRPQELINLQVYASGHEYDVFLAELSLHVSAGADSGAANEESP